MSRAYSTPCARELGYEMRVRRERAKVSSAELARMLGWAGSKLSRVESGLYPLSDKEVSLYLGWCRVPPADVDYLMELKDIDSRNLNFWLRATDSTRPVSPALRSLVYHESTAAASTNYEPDIIPGLLQTEDYTHALFRAWDPSETMFKTRLRIRMDRQTILKGRNPSTFTAFIHEQALHLEVGDTRTMHDQLLHLVFATSRPNISIRVVPASAGARTAIGGPFLLLDYPKKHRPLVYHEESGGALFVDDAGYIDRYRSLLPKLADTALSETASRELLVTFASTYDLSG